MHTYQHDLESLFWLLLWILLTRLNHQPSIEAASTAFQDGHDIHARGVALKHGFNPTLHDSFHSKVIQVRDGLGAVRRQLYRFYKKLSPQELRDPVSYHLVCGQYLKSFSEINEPVFRVVWGKLPLSPPSTSFTSANMLSTTTATTVTDHRKRKHDEQTGDDNQDEVSPSEGRMDFFTDSYRWKRTKTV